MKFSLLALLSSFAIADSSGIFFIDMNLSKSETDAVRKRAASEGRPVLFCTQPQTTEAVTACLNEAKSKGISSFGTVIVSGHHHNQSMTYFGGAAQLRQENLADAFKGFPEYTQDVRSLHLAGCYTAMPGTLKYNWNKIFPNALESDGFQLKGPLGTSPASPKYLDWALTHEELLQTGSDEAIQAELLKTKGFTDKGLAVCKRESFISRTQYISDEALRKLCGDVAGVERLRKLYEPVKCFIEAKEDRCANPDMSDTGPLRTFYGELQQYDICVDVDSALANKFSEFPKSAAILYLIDFKVVLANFSKYFAKDIENLKPIFKKTPELAAFNLGKLKSMSRQEAMRLNDALITASSGASFGEQRTRLTRFAAVFSDLVSGLNPECIPLTWVVEPTGTPGPPTCNYVSN